MSFIRLRGIGVSPGIGMGETLLSEKVLFAARREVVPASRVAAEIKRLNTAIARTEQDLLQWKRDVESRMGEEHVFIFDAHLLILKDPSLFQAVEKIIREEKVMAEWALTRVHKKYQDLFDSLDDDYFRQRKFDVSDVLARVYANLGRNKSHKRPENRAQKVILVAHDLLPSEAVMSFSQGNVLAVAMDTGGATSHTAILARSLNIPAVVGLHDVARQVKNGDYLIVDGTNGEVLINPPLAIRKEFQSKRQPL